MFAVGGLGFEFSEFVVGWRQALLEGVAYYYYYYYYCYYRSLEWNWPKEAMNIPIWAGIVDGAKLF